jgi:DNA-directed RNA polymerase delta subunit
VGDHTKSELDWACEILEKNREPMFYLELIRAVGKKTKTAYGHEAVNSLYTAMNMDNRLEYEGEGYWFLTNGRGVSRKER